MINFLWVIGVSIACGICYRISGKGGFKGAKLIRRLICSFLALGLFLRLQGLNLAYWWAYLAFWGLNYGALSSYWSELQKPKDDVSAIEWFATGIIYGVAAFPLIWCGIPWWAIATRTIGLGLLTMVWSINIGNATIEEFGRGFLYCVSIPILLL